MGTWAIRRTGRLAAQCAISCAALFLPASAFAESAQGVEPREVSRLTVRYVGPPDCSSAQDFVRRTSRRLSGIVLVPSQGRATLEVTLSRQQDEVTASLSVLLKGGGTLNRSIVAGSCDEAAEAIAFVASVALDPGARDPIRVRRPGERELRDEPRDRNVPPQKKNSLRGAARSGTALSGELGSEGARRSGVPVGLVGVGALVSVGPAPLVLPGAHLFVSWGETVPGLWAPSVRMALGFQRRGGYEQPAGVADFELVKLQTGFCPSLLRLGAAKLRGCGIVSVGVLMAEGKNTREASRASRLWLQPGVELSLSLPLGKQFEFALRGALGAPLIRDAFQFDSRVFHRVPVVTGQGGAEFGAKFQ